MKKYSEEDINKIYEDYCEEYNEPAGEPVRNAIRDYSNALDEYIAAVSQDGFRRGFQHALRLMERGAIA